MLNLLDLEVSTRGPGLSASAVGSNMQNAFKDLDVGPFDVADKFFKADGGDFEQRLRHYFVDSSMTPLLVQENYLSAGIMTPQGPGWPAAKQQAFQLHRTQMAAEYIAMSDVVGTRILKEQQWGLAAHGALSCIAPGVCARLAVAPVPLLRAQLDGD